MPDNEQVNFISLPFCVTCMYNQTKTRDVVFEMQFYHVNHVNVFPDFKTESHK